MKSTIYIFYFDHLVKIFVNFSFFHSFKKEKQEKTVILYEAVIKTQISFVISSVMQGRHLSSSRLSKVYI